MLLLTEIEKLKEKADQKGRKMISSLSMFICNKGEDTQHAKERCRIFIQKNCHGHEYIRNGIFSQGQQLKLLGKNEQEKFIKRSEGEPTANLGESSQNLRILLYRKFLRSELRTMVYKVLYGLKFSICLASPNTSHLALFALAIWPLTLLLPPLQALSPPI